MAYQKTAFEQQVIVAQNAATAAATLLQGTGAGVEEFERVRTAIYQGSMALGNGGSVGTPSVTPEENLQSMTVPQSTATAATTPPSGGAGDFVVEFGKFKGETIAQIAEHDPSYVEWLAESAKNEGVRNGALRYLREAA